MIIRCKCKRCMYDWEPKSTKRPEQCPRCHSTYWDRDYVRSDKVHLNKRLS